MRSGQILTAILALALACPALANETEGDSTAVAVDAQAIDAPAEVQADPALAAAPANDAVADSPEPELDELEAEFVEIPGAMPVGMPEGLETPDEPAEAPVEAAVAKREAVLGELGYDGKGRPGRIHVVVRGDTLWDISDAYLGTPWVWPSIWTDNDDIANPHLILPDDRIWITPYEMRRVTAAEADRLLAGQPLDELPPAAFGEEASLDLMDSREVRTLPVSSVETTGLITSEQLEAAASIVDSVPDRVMLSQGDELYIGYGEADATLGDQFTVFRTREKVYDPETGRLLGFHVDVLGWVEVVRVDTETSLAKVELSATEMEIGDRVIPREPPVIDVEILESPEGVEGQISFFPHSRVLMGTIDYVYLNRGELDGLQVGSPLEVYRTGWKAPEPARGERVEVPDRVVAQMLVVRSQPQTAVALVTHTDTELELGDHFRAAAP
jgi:hypothetical protein